MKRLPSVPVALTIAGSDSGGGAGVQADLQAFAAIGVHGTTAITCLTAQNPRGVRGLETVAPGFVLAQLEAVFAELRPAAVKTGMLYSTGIVRVVAEFFGQRGAPPLVVDPVMVATSGARLLKPAAIAAIRALLLPRATLVTPNVDEAEILTGRAIRGEEDLRTTARLLRDLGPRAVLVKGGHLRGGNQAVDVFWDGREELLLSAPFVRGVSTHGTGCTYSAAITAYLALGCPLAHAVQMAKGHVTQAIAQARRAAGHDVLNHFWTG